MFLASHQHHNLLTDLLKSETQFSFRTLSYLVINFYLFFETPPRFYHLPGGFLCVQHHPILFPSSHYLEFYILLWSYVIVKIFCLSLSSCNCHFLGQRVDVFFLLIRPCLPQYPTDRVHSTDLTNASLPDSCDWESFTVTRYFIWSMYFRDGTL